LKERSCAERELKAAYVSGCECCHGVDTATAERMDVEAGLLQRIVPDDELTDVGPKLRPVLALTADVVTRLRDQGRCESGGGGRMGRRGALLRSRRARVPSIS